MSERRLLVTTFLIAFLKVVCVQIMVSAAKIFIYRQTCVDTYQNMTTCSNLSAAEENNVQLSAKNVIMLHRVFIETFNLLPTFMSGVWLTKMGGKLLLQIASGLALLPVGVYCITGFLHDAGSYIWIPLLMTATALEGLLGKAVLYSLTLTTYVSRLSTVEHRTRNMGLISASNNFAMFCAYLLYGQVLHSVSFLDTVFVVGGLLVVVLMLALFCVQDISDVVEDKKSEKLRGDEKGESEKKEKKGFKLKDLLHFKNFYDTVAILFKEREAHGRSRILIIFVIDFLHLACSLGDHDATLLFTFNAPLSWTVQEYMTLVMFQYGSVIIYNLIILRAIIYIFKPSDHTILLVGFVFACGGMTFRAFVNTTWKMYLTLGLITFRSVIPSTCKSMMTKIIPKDELPMVLALHLFVKIFARLSASPLLVGIYSIGLRAGGFRGGAYLFEACVYVFLFIILSVSMFIFRNDPIPNESKQDLKKVNDEEKADEKALLTKHIEVSDEDNFSKNLKNSVLPRSYYTGNIKGAYSGIVLDNLKLNIEAVKNIMSTLLIYKVNALNKAKKSQGTNIP